MAKLKCQLGERKQIADGTMSFRVELSGQSISFEPGQFVRVLLPAPLYPDPQSDARTLSIASAPSDPFVLFALRMTGSAYKRSLADAPAGAPVILSNPSGDFVLDSASDAPVALFAGGIGITPFRSMIKHALDQHSGRHLTLIYSNRCPEQAAFLDELEAWAQNNPRFTLVATMTQPEKSQRGWTGPTGYVDAHFVRKYLPEAPAGGCYVAGPPRFIEGVTQALEEVGVDAEQVRTDEFTGY